MNKIVKQKWRSCLIAIFALINVAVLSGCGGAEGFPDGRVDAFSFQPATGVDPDTEVTSNAITVSGIDIEVSISISGPAGANAQYNIDGGAFTASPGMVANGQQVRVRLTSAATEATRSEAVLTIGDRSVAFSVSTIGSQLPELISTATATSVQLGAAGDGTAFAVFVDNDSIFANRFDGLAWEDAVEIDAGAAVALAPYVGADESGNAIAIWAQGDGAGEDAIYASHYTVGSGWSSAVEITTDAGWAQNPHLAVNNAGQAVAAWTQFLGTPASIVAATYNGTAWSAAVAIENVDDDMTNYSFPRAAIDADGNAAATWQGMNNTANDGHIYVNRFDASTGWGTHSLLGGEGESFTPQITFLSGGEALVVWEQFGTFNLVYSSITPAGQNTWSSPAPIGDTTNTIYPNQTRLAADGLGNAISVYLKNGNVLYATRYIAGAGWESSALELDTTPNAFANEPTAVAMDAVGNVLVAYETAGNIGIVTYDVAGNMWSEPEIVDQSADDATAPVISINTLGETFFYAWQQAGIIAFQYAPL